MRRRAIRGLMVASVLLLLGAAVETASLVQSTGQLNQGAGNLREAAASLGTDPGKWTPDRIATAETLQKAALGQLAAADKGLRDDPLLRTLAGTPGFGPEIRDLTDLSAASQAGAEAFGDFLSVARAVDESRGSPAPAGQRLLNLIDASAAPWSDADARLGPKVAALQGDDRRSAPSLLHAQVRQALDLLQPVADEAHLGSIAAQFAPSALGKDRAQNYLVLLDNPSEIRPAGGFAGAVGNITVSHGAPTTIDIKNQESFNPLIKKKVDPPYPMGRYLHFFKNSLELGDAGWDPNFPTSAQLSEQIYQGATGQPVDGTIAIDPYAISALLEVTGPVDVPGYGTFTSSDFFPKLNFIVNASNAPGSGKGALGPISQVVLKTVLTQPASQFPRLISVFAHQAGARHIQSYLHDSSLADAAAKVHFDGSIVANPDDYLMVADGNVGATKGDYFVQKSMDVQTEVASSGVVRHALTLHYQMPVAVDTTDQALNPGDGSYRDYVRFYLPETANVVGFSTSLDGHDGQAGIDSIGLEHGKQVVGAFFRLPRGHEIVLHLQYQVALSPGPSYRLLIQKQAGQLVLPTTLKVSDPAGIVSRQLDMSTDSEVALAW